MKKVFFSILAYSLITNLTSQKLKMYERIPREVVEHHTLLTLNDQRGFHIYNAGCVVGRMRFAVGVFDIIDKKTFSEFHYKSITDYHATKTYEYSYNPQSTGLDVIVIDVAGDTLLLDSLALGRENNYQLKSPKGINASSDYNTFHISANNKLTHFTLPGFYRIFKHDVIYELPSEGFNTITIHLTIPLAFYIEDESMYELIWFLDYGVLKMKYTTNNWSYFKSKKGDYSFARDELREIEYFKHFERKHFKKKK